MKRFLLHRSQTITSAAAIVGVAAFFSRVLGVLRDRVLAGEFGAGIELDMYYAAFRLPDLVFNLLVLGALSAGFIPVFTSYLNKKEKSWELVTNVLWTLLIVLLLLLGLIYFLAPWLVQIITPGFTSEQLAITTQLTRIMLLSPLLLGISSVFGGILQSYKQFFIYSLAPLFYNIGIIVGALYFAPLYGLTGLAWGVVFGAALHMTVQLPPVVLLGYRFRFALDLTDKGLRRIIMVMGPRVMGLLVTQFNMFIVTILGSMLAVGSIAIFNFANNLQSFPLGVFGIAFAIAAFPTLSELANNHKKFADTILVTVKQILLLIIPSSVLLIVLRAQIVRVILGTGRFDWTDTVATLESLTFFAISLFAQALVVLFIRAFYALEDSKTPFYIGLVSVFANIMLSLMLIEQLGVAGLAFAFSLATLLQLVLLWLFLHRKLDEFRSRDMMIYLSKILTGAFVMGLVAQAAKFGVEPYVLTDRFWGIAIQATVAILAGLMTYMAIIWLLRVEELKIFLLACKRKMSRKKSFPPLEIELTD